jgi:hypothetical protein
VPVGIPRGDGRVLSKHSPTAGKAGAVLNSGTVAQPIRIIYATGVAGMPGAGIMTGSSIPEFGTVGG